MQDPTTNGGEAAVAYFSESLDGNMAVQLAAAVFCRGVPTPAALLGGGGPLGWVRSMRHRLWLRLGPLGADVSVAGRSLFGGDAWAPRCVGSVRPRSHGAPLGYYDTGSRMLRVLGRVLPAPPPGRTLVTLVDATGRRASSPRLVLRVVPTPTVAAVQPPDPAPPPDVATSLVVVGGDQPEWSEALRADPVVRAFLDGHAL